MSHKKLAPWRERMYEIIFEADTRAGMQFDVFLLWAIVFSVVAIMLESVIEIQAIWQTELKAIQWFFTIFFVIEYICRIISVRRPLGYIFSFFGIIDLLSLIPTFINPLIPGVQALLVIRIFRLQRVFHIFKMGDFTLESNVLSQALKASRAKIIVFLVAVVCICIIMGTIMFLIEGPRHGFSSIPRGVYWAIVTMTTVGFGDITPHTALGQAIASFIMILGYGILAVPTGIVSSELTRTGGPVKFYSMKTCPSCDKSGHDQDAKHCKYCGTSL